MDSAIRGGDLLNSGDAIGQLDLRLDSEGQSFVSDMAPTLRCGRCRKVMH